MQRDPWQVSEAGFPREGSLADKLRFLVGYAILAPSGHNAQPWQFKVDHDAIEIHADRTRALPVVDPDDRELTVSCGAALFHLRLAMHAFQMGYRTELLPEPHSRDLLARLCVEGSVSATFEEEQLFRAIPRRRTNRTAFAPEPFPDDVLVGLEHAVLDEGAWLVPLRGEQAREAASQLVAEGDRIQFADPRFRRELAAWVRPNHSPSGDGIPGYAMGLGGLASLAEPMVIRTFDLGKGQAAKDRQLAEGSPLLAILGTEVDTPQAWLRAGQGMEKMLLRVTVEGYSASFLNQPIELAGLRPKVSALVGWKCCPQLLLRLGRGKEAPHTPRRTVGEVLL